MRLGPAKAEQASFELHFHEHRQRMVWAAVQTTRHRPHKTDATSTCDVSCCVAAVGKSLHRLSHTANVKACHTHACSVCMCMNSTTVHGSLHVHDMRSMYMGCNVVAAPTMSHPVAVILPTVISWTLPTNRHRSEAVQYDVCTLAVTAQLSTTQVNHTSKLNTTPRSCCCCATAHPIHPAHPEVGVAT